MHNFYETGLRFVPRLIKTVLYKGRPKHTLASISPQKKNLVADIDSQSLQSLQSSIYYHGRGWILCHCSAGCCFFCFNGEPSKGFSRETPTSSCNIELHSPKYCSIDFRECFFSFLYMVLLNADDPRMMAHTSTCKELL